MIAAMQKHDLVKNEKKDPKVGSNQQRFVSFSEKVTKSREQSAEICII
ncbi:hypothetical protein [Gracilibacillus salinarum]|uniref:Uncharacterized protein n=1 Tax=Gracilibacillus salinarum TaxID=2932255 RepID=A0ABY4GKM9_9BACI|nr:hypothetical protein [Gracilibacillus salinarum]UOQ84515.1 hypothetical protein MUN87_17790 [Gracilibacillus salinarum]